MGKKITIRDIAAEAGVSITAVSFVLNGKGGSINKKTAQRILDVCEKHNYKRNYIAIALKNKSTHVVGILVPDIENGYYSRIIKCLEGKLHDLGYSLIIANSGYDIHDFKENIENLIEKQVDYCIIVPPSKVSLESKKTLRDIRDILNVPYVILDRKLDFGNTSIVINNDVNGGYIATKYLLDNGHKEIACITGPNSVSSSSDRLKGYKKALEDNNIEFDPSLIYEGNYEFDGIEEKVRDIIINKGIKAIFAFNDLMAYAVYKVCTEQKLVIGKDISIVGFDDNQFSSLITPGLTSVRQNIELLCDSTIKSMFATKAFGEPTIIEPTLIVRGSVKNVSSN